MIDLTKSHESAIGAETNEVEAEVQRSMLDRAKDCYEDHKLKILLGATATSGIATYANESTSEVLHEAVDTLPWVGAGIAVSEGLFVAGAVMMVASVREKIGNPFTVGKRMKELGAKAHGNKLFQAGFWTNTTGAVGDFVVLSAAVVGKMPVESYPLLALPLADLGVTIAVRKAMLDGIHKSVEDSENSEDTL